MWIFSLVFPSPGVPAFFLLPSTFKPGNVDGGGGGGAREGQFPVPTVPGFGTDNGGTHGNASADAQPPGAAGDSLPPGDDAGTAALEGRRSSADVLVS